MYCYRFALSLPGLRWSIVASCQQIFPEQISTRQAGSDEWNPICGNSCSILILYFFFVFCFFLVQVFDISTDPIRYTNSFDMRLNIFCFFYCYKAPFKHTPRGSLVR